MSGYKSPSKLFKVQFAVLLCSIVVFAITCPTRGDARARSRTRGQRPIGQRPILLVRRDVWTGRSRRTRRTCLSCTTVPQSGTANRYRGDCLRVREQRFCGLPYARRWPRFASSRPRFPYPWHGLSFGSDKAGGPPFGGQNTPR